MSHSSWLLLAALALVLVTFLVCVRLYVVRFAEMSRKRLRPQALSGSEQMTALLSDTRASDHFKNLFETPLLFYALVAASLGSAYMPGWLIAGAWVYVGLRAAQGVVHCSYNKVVHRFALFVSGFMLLVALWVGFVLGYLGRAAV